MNPIALVALLLVTPPSASGVDPAESPHPALAAVESGVALGLGALTVGMVLGGGAVAGVASSPWTAPLAPALFPPSIREGSWAWAMPLVAGLVVGVAAAAPVALVLGAVVDTVAWLGLAGVPRERMLVRLVLVHLLGVGVTLPALLAAGAFGVAVAWAARWQADMLEKNEDRRRLTAVVGLGAPLVLVAVPVAISAAVLRAGTWAVLSDGSPGPAWYRRFQAPRE